MPTDRPDRPSHGELLRRLEALKEQTERKRQELDALLAAVRQTVQDNRDARARRSPRRGASGSRAWHTLLEAKALAERSSEAKSQMLRTVAHDLRQPLQVIIAAAGQLEAHVPEARRHLLQRIDQSATRIERTLSTLLEAARIEAAGGRREAIPVRLAGLLRDIEEQFRPSAEAKGLAFRVVPAELQVLSDPSALASILQNLVGNAVKYTDKGRVLVGCRRRGPNGVRSWLDGRS
jgi:signal transduction histidine kinase